MSTTHLPREAAHRAASRPHGRDADPAERASGTEPAEAATDFDVLIVGAGLSGIGAAHHLRQRCPWASFAILESRATLGGTWDLFRYPGVRSDSDMFTLGYSFRPWHSDQAIAEGGTILDYIRDTAREADIERTIRFHHRVTAANWDSATARWQVEVLRGDGTDGQPRQALRFTCRFLYMCSGYYDYEQGHAPSWPGMESFRGRIVHPQHWPRDLDYAGKRVVVIGSGATAVTLVPSMAREAAHVTMLQRSPTYIVSMPARDKLAARLRRWLPAGLAHRLVRVRNVLLTMSVYRFARRRPEAAKRFILRAASRQLGPEFDVAKHLTPRYAPWDQRLCLVPNGDLFKAIRAGDASIATDEIERFTPEGLLLKSGRTLEADLVVSATGLKVRMLGGATLSVDGCPVEFGEAVSYKGMMASGVPNLATSFGYINASWTLKAELIALYVCRLLNHMRAHGYDSCTPTLDDAAMPLAPAVELSSGYIQRAAALLPKQGPRNPWKSHQNYARDLALLRFGSLVDGAMRFARRPAQAGQAAAPAERHAASEPAYERR
ncbi:flavin-containing monooxygenase [Burkholderia glumae]|uniref:NAD(P)/FAD-dependent oxidoreductase n=2 Tax=Burkholderia glumae TaxID=337 RepID=A0AAP9XZU3_BURGL|nr:NAD(P)/FAD-dependent oxidoreductase [Burkholderia glumae]ACR32068.1 Arylesterase/monooxygenase [Burkholderia glumae BGR1]AJY64202.1 FAD dependent oxidoreductase family protein [Burkholderia glumae LMG 2196 = ATCC 33617]MCM2484755.1 NAD(P)/FAD-dependent oxidoreductase [Burkholderia glumae]MCM2510448.1 NAD(P)/FAD-dependent oxidoreductase [Burkholderia glumae]MCM2540214.1 NAD(P)/FAD-dependent oxidoreductase [Burkholderia glumae]